MTLHKLEKPQSHRVQRLNVSSATSTDQDWDQLLHRGIYRSRKVFMVKLNDCCLSNDFIVARRGRETRRAVGAAEVPAGSLNRKARISSGPPGQIKVYQQNNTRETSIAAADLTDFTDREFQSVDLSASAFLSNGKQSHFQNNCIFRTEGINREFLGQFSMGISMLPPIPLLFIESSSHRHLYN